MSKRIYLQNMRKMKGLVILSLTILFLVPVILHAFTLGNYTGYPQPYVYDLTLVSPVVADVDINSNGLEIVIGGWDPGHSADSVLRIYYENGSFSQTFPSEIIDYSSPAVGDVDGNSLNGLEIVMSRYAPPNYKLYVYHSNLSIYGSIALDDVGNSPALGDIDNDGGLEIVIAERSGTIKAIDSDLSSIWNYSTGVIENTPVLADIDGDGFLEIIVAPANGNVIALNHDGSLYRSFSPSTSVSKASPAAGDVDNDGDLEIVVAASNGVYIWHHNGSLVSGWPQLTSISSSSPALGDLDGDGYLEIVVGAFSAGDNLYAWYYNGTEKFRAQLDSFNVASSPILADLDNDDRAEVIIAYLDTSQSSSELAIVDYAGTIVNTISLVGTTSLSTPAVADINEDNEPEIIVVTEGGNGKIHVYTVTDGAYVFEKNPWPMYHRDAQNTGSQSPIAKIIEPTSGSFYRNTPILFNGTGLSFGGGLTYSWTSNGTVIGNTPSFSKSDLPLGSNIIKLKVVDGNNYFDESANVVLNILNNPPTTGISSPSNNQVFNPNENISFTGSASDPDGNIASYTWTANSTLIYSNNSVNAQSVSMSFNNSSLPIGTHTINFTAVDSDSTITTTQITIKVNSPPTANIISPANTSTHNQGSTITFNGTGNDSDGTITAYYWLADGSSIGTTPSFTHSFANAGKKTIELIVTDDSGSNSSSTIEITIKSTGGNGGGGGSGGGGGGGGVSPSGGEFTVFDGKGVLTEPDFKEIIEFFRHDSGDKFSFDRQTAPLVSLFAARDEVVMLDKLTNFLISSVKGFEMNLHKKEDTDVYDEAVNYILEKRPGFDDLIVTRGDLYVDSLAVVPFAKLIGAPVILVRPNEIPSTVYKVLEKMEGKGRIYVIGGSEAVSEAVEDELEGYASKVIRLGGETRYETSVEIAKEVQALAESHLVISVSGKEPALYSATMAGKYRAPIVYMDEPIVRESTFRDHSVVEGTLRVENFDSSRLEVLSDKRSVASMEFNLDQPDIGNAWMYVRMRGFDSASEKWIVRLNERALTYNTHTEPVATYGTGQFIRFDVGDIILNGLNTLIIEGTGFNLDDQFYLTGVSLVMEIEDSSKKTEYWIKEGFDKAFYEEPQFGLVKEAHLYSMYLKSSETSSIYFNGERLHPISRSGNFFTIKEADVSSRVIEENTFESKGIADDSTSPISILTVETDALPITETGPEKVLDRHQQTVKSFITENFDLIGLMYYQDTIEA
jgi:hypothetical protein